MFHQPFSLEMLARMYAFAILKGFKVHYEKVDGLDCTAGLWLWKKIVMRLSTMAAGLLLRTMKY